MQLAVDLSRPWRDEQTTCQLPLALRPGSRQASPQLIREPLGSVGSYMKAPSWHYLLIIFGFLTIFGLARAGGVTPHTGTVKGLILDANSGAPIAFANVLIVGTSLGGMTMDDGSFTIPEVPFGVVKIAVLLMSYRPLKLDSVVIQSGKETFLNITLEKIWPEQESESRFVVGTEVHISADDLSCQIQPAKERFTVGDTPNFDVVLRNNSDETFFLVGAIDDSESKTRYPHVTLTIEGPENGISSPKFARCGFQNPLTMRDFVEMPPGGTIEPITCPFWPPSDAVHARFAKPGRYVITFQYSSNEIDYAHWVGTSSGGFAPQPVIDTLKRVPRVEVECSITIEVYK
jgi:hypothetical protein